MGLEAETKPAINTPVITDMIWTNEHDYKMTCEHQSFLVVWTYVLFKIEKELPEELNNLN